MGLGTMIELKGEWIMQWMEPKTNTPEWLKYMAIALICGLVAVDGIGTVMADDSEKVGRSVSPTKVNDEEGEAGSRFVMESDLVAARLGGYHGILTFLHQFAVPTLLADSEIAPFFGNLTTTPEDIEQCLAMMLDHDLGGSSRHSGTLLESGHRCRSSMAKIHRGRQIPDQAITRFIAIVGEQAALVGVSSTDIKVIAKVLERNRGGIRNK